MIKGAPSRWLGFLGILVVLAFTGLAVWLSQIQVRDHGQWGRLSLGNAQRAIARVASRGDILDARGTPLAITVPAKTVCADPSLIYTQRAQVARLLAPLLQMDAADLYQRLAPKLRTNSTGRLATNAFVLLKHQVPLDQWRQITNAMAGLDLGPKPRRSDSALGLAQNALRTRAIFGVDDPLRRYPSQSLAAHVLGFVSSSEAQTDHGRVYEMHGQGGIEKTFDKVLNGLPGWRSRNEDIAARRGLNVVLTLDAGVQAIVEEELAKVMARFKPESVCAIVVRPKTGEILALANLPTFDPNQPGTNVAASFDNHIISDAYEPGSTFKIVTIATALNDGKISLGETVFCENGYWSQYRLRDAHGYGTLTFEDVVAKSSNIGTAKAALRLGATRLYNTVTNFGFGLYTGIPLPDESRGRIAHPRSWDGRTITRVPMGQSIMTTPLQMVMAMSAIANGGLLMQPLIVQRLEDDQGHVIRRAAPMVLHRVVSEPAARELVRALKSVASDEGTGKAAQLDYYTVGGKTGTAQQTVNGVYGPSVYYSSFIGFFPADNPELCILVGVDRPDVHIAHYGGTVAAPAFKAIAERAAGYLRIAPDLQPGLNPETAPKPRPEPPPELANRRAYATTHPPSSAALARR